LADPENIGLIHAAPAKRYVTGRQLWDDKYKHATKRVSRARAREAEKAARDEESRMHSFARRMHMASQREQEEATNDFYAVWRMDNETPPPSSRKRIFRCACFCQKLTCCASSRLAKRYTPSFEIGPMFECTTRIKICKIRGLTLAKDSKDPLVGIQ